MKFQASCFSSLVSCQACLSSFSFTRLVGGWDKAGLDEFAEASQMTGFLRPFVNIAFILPSQWGARISPLHNRFPITMRDAAMTEATLLTDQKVNLVEG